VVAAACGRGTPQAERRPPPPAPTIQPLAPPRPLDRADVIAAARLAADAYAAGAPYPPDVAKLVDARFEVRLPLGCAGAQDEPKTGYSVDAKRRTLTVRATPEVWTATPWVTALLGPEKPEAIEGFWVRRPWLTSDACPALTAGQTAAPPAPETLGLVRLFAAGGARMLRHGERGYEVVKKVEPGVLRLQGFRLVLAGRIADFGARQPVRCRGDSPDQRPVCLVAVDVDRLAFEDPLSGEVLAEWPS
jgi:hypothetical protein